MPENAMLVLHDPSGLVAGTASDMRAMAEALDRMKAGSRLPPLSLSSAASSSAPGV
jgi:ATP-dependent protease ClpP protease subunit